MLENFQVCLPFRFFFNQLSLFVYCVCVTLISLIFAVHYLNLYQQVEVHFEALLY